MKHKPLKAPKGPLGIANQLRWLSEHMKDIGTSMNYYGEFSEFMVYRGEELVGAGLVAESWAEEIEREAAEKEPESMGAELPPAPKQPERNPKE